MQNRSLTGLRCFYDSVLKDLIQQLHSYIKQSKIKITQKAESYLGYFLKIKK